MTQGKIISLRLEDAELADIDWLAAQHETLRSDLIRRVLRAAVARERQRVADRG